MAIQPVFWLTFAALTGYVALLWKEKVHLPIGEAHPPGSLCCHGYCFLPPFSGAPVGVRRLSAPDQRLAKRLPTREFLPGVVDCLIGSLYYDTTPPKRPGLQLQHGEGHSGRL